MLKTFVRWIVPLLVLTLIAAYLLVAPMMRTHAAAPIAPAHQAAPHTAGHHDATPDFHWHF